MTNAPVVAFRRWALVVVAVGCLAIAAFASRSGSPGLQTGLADVDLFTLVEVGGYVAIGVGLVLLPWVVLERARRRLRREPAPRAPGESAGLPRWAMVLAGVAAFGIVALQLGAIVTFMQALAATPGAAGRPGLDPDAQAPGPLASVRDSPALLIATVILIGLGVLAVGVAIVWRRLDAAERGQDGETRREQLRESVALGIDALCSEADPRLAVIGAYAAMERSMATVGLGRARSEAPREYLHRITAAARVAEDAADDARTISHLFQVAMFSAGAVDEAMRQAAITALEGLRSSLARGPAIGHSPGHLPVPAP